MGTTSTTSGCAGNHQHTNHSVFRSIFQWLFCDDYEIEDEISKNYITKASMALDEAINELNREIGKKEEEEEKDS